MKTLSGSYSKFSASNHTEKARAFGCSSEIALSRREIGFLVRQKRVRDGFSLAFSFQLKRVRSISAVSSTAQVMLKYNHFRNLVLFSPISCGSLCKIYLFINYFDI